MNLKVGVLQCSCSYGFLLDYHYPRAHTTARRWRDPPPTCLNRPSRRHVDACNPDVGCRMWMCAEERPGADHGPRAGPGARRTPPTRAVVRRHARAAKRQMETRCASDPIRHPPRRTLRHPVGRCGHDCQINIMCVSHVRATSTRPRPRAFEFRYGGHRPVPPWGVASRTRLSVLSSQLSSCVLTHSY